MEIVTRVLLQIQWKIQQRKNFENCEHFSKLRTNVQCESKKYPSLNFFFAISLRLSIFP